MTDFTAVFTDERDQWRVRAEAAEAEVERLRERETDLGGVLAVRRREVVELRVEVERLRGALDRVEQFAREQALTDRVRSGPNRSTDSEERYWLDVLALVEAVLRGGQ